MSRESIATATIKDNPHSPKHFEIDDNLRKRAAAITYMMSQDYNTTVSVGPPGSGWHWDFKNNHVNMDAADLANKPEAVVLGSAAHEGNHRSTSRLEYLQDIWQQHGASFGINAAEDPRVNQNGIAMKPGTKEWIQSYIEEDLSPGGGLDYMNISKDTKSAIGYVPKYMQWGAEMIRYWHHKELTGELQTPENRQAFIDAIPDEEVRGCVSSTLDSFEKYYQQIPVSRDEMVIKQKAKESSDTFKDGIWPDYQKLVEKSYQDHSLVKMLQDMLSQDGQESSGGGQIIAIPFSSLPQEVQDEIKQKIKEQSQGELGKDQEEGAEEKESSAEGSGDGQKNGGQPQIRWNDLSKDAKDAADQAFKQLPDDKQEKYREKAKQELESAEDAANEKLRGKMSDPRHQQTHQEQEQQEAEEDEKAEEQVQQRPMMSNMQQKREEALAGLKGDRYFEFLVQPDVAAIIRRGDREYKKIFEPNEDPNVRHAYSGLAPSMRRAMQYEADPKRGDVFEIHGSPQEKSHRFLRLVDLSPSMQTIIDETFKAIVTDTELFNKHRLEDGVAGFNGLFRGVLKIYRDFSSQRLTKQDREKIGEMLEDVYSGSGTPLLRASLLAFELISKRNRRKPTKNNYFITLTDGQPTDSSVEDLANAVREMRQTREIVTAGFGVGYGTEFVNEVYPVLPERVRVDVARALNKNIADIGNSFADILEFSQARSIIIGYMVRLPELFHTN